MKKVILLVAALALYVLHQDFWHWKTYEPLVFGFLPIGLAYHAAFSVCCALMMWGFVSVMWPSHLESLTDHKEGGERRE